MPIVFKKYNSIPDYITDKGKLDDFIVDSPEYVHKVVMTYDASGARVKKESFSFDGTKQSGVAYFDEAVFTYNIESQSYEFSYLQVGGDGVVRSDGSFEYYIKDHLGSTHHVISADGHVQEAIDYLAYGKDLHRVTSPKEARETFTGKEFDGDGGIDIISAHNTMISRSDCGCQHRK